MSSNWIAAYQNTFGRDAETRAVLTDLLNELDHFNIVTTDHDAHVRQNAAKMILWKLGVFREGNANAITQSYLNVDWEEMNE